MKIIIRQCTIISYIVERMKSTKRSKSILLILSIRLMLSNLTKIN